MRDETCEVALLPTTTRPHRTRTDFYGLTKAILFAGVTVLGSHLFAPRPVMADAPRPLSAQTNETDATKVALLTLEISQKTKGLLGAQVTEALGYPISRAWFGVDGFQYRAHQGGIVQVSPDGNLHLWNTLDQMHAYGLDTQLANGSLGVTVPNHIDFNDSGEPANVFDERVVRFAIPKRVVDYANDLRRKVEIGSFTSSGEDWGPYTVYRTQRYGIQVWDDGKIQRILVGDAAKAAGLIPQEALYAEPQLSEPELRPLIQEVGSLEKYNILIKNQGPIALIPTDFDYLSKKALERKTKISITIHDGYYTVPIIENIQDPNHGYYDLNIQGLKDNKGQFLGVYRYARFSVFKRPNQTLELHIGFIPEFTTIFNEDNNNLISKALSRDLAIYLQYGTLPPQWPLQLLPNGSHGTVPPEADLRLFYEESPILRLLQLE